MRAARLAIVLLAAGCASDTGPWATRALTADPGETLLVDPDAVRAELACDRVEALPLVVVEADGIEPAEAPPGARVVHRLVYAFCPKRGSATLDAEFRRTFSREGRIVHTAVDDGFAFKPGRWSVEREIHVPEQALPGPYAVRVEFRSDAYRYRNTLQLRVTPSPPTE